MNRRQFLQTLPLASVTAGVCAQVAGQTKETPTELKPGQVWVAPDNTQYVVTYEVASPLFYQLAAIGKRKWMVACIEELGWWKWTYFGTLAELAGGAR